MKSKFMCTMLTVAFCFLSTLTFANDGWYCPSKSQASINAQVGAYGFYQTGDENTGTQSAYSVLGTIQTLDPKTLSGIASGEASAPLDPDFTVAAALGSLCLKANAKHSDLKGELHLIQAAWENKATDTNNYALGIEVGAVDAKDTVHGKNVSLGLNGFTMGYVQTSQVWTPESSVSQGVVGNLGLVTPFCGADTAINLRGQLNLSAMSIKGDTYGFGRLQGIYELKVPNYGAAEMGGKTTSGVNTIPDGIGSKGTVNGYFKKN